MLKSGQMRYLTEVLGIDTVIRSRDSTAAPRSNATAETETETAAVTELRPAVLERRKGFREGAADAPFVFFVRSSAETFEISSEYELLQKIIAATKLSGDKYCVVQVDSISYLESFVATNNSQAAVFFAGQNAGSIKRYGECAVLFTHSLKQLEADQALKKSTWTGLQEILRSSLK